MSRPADLSALDPSGKLSRLVRIRTCASAETSSGTEHHRRFRQELEALFPRCFASLQHSHESDRALLLIWPGARPELPAVALGAHWDVVPADDRDENQWTYPPFSGHVDDDFVWGRGTLDDKMSVAAILEAVEGLLASSFSPARTICICFGGDEESGGSVGAAGIVDALERGGIRLQFLLDEGSVVTNGIFEPALRPLALVGVAEKGFANVRLRVTEAGGRASMPPRRSAAGRIARAVQRIERSPFPARLTGTLQSMLRTASEAMQGMPRVLCSHPRLFRRTLLRTLGANVSTNALIRTTQAVTTLRAAGAPEVLPAGAEAVVNIRILPGDSVASVLARTAAVVEDPMVTVELLPDAETSEPVEPSSIESEPFKLLCRVTEAVFPEALCAPFLIAASTDSRRYRHLTGSIFRFTPVILQPADLRRIHGIDERVSHRNVARAVAFYRELILASAGQAPSNR